MAAHHVEIHDAEGRVVCMADLEANKVGDIEAVRSEDTVGILLLGQTVAVGYMTIAQAEQPRKEWTVVRYPLAGGSPVVKKL